MVVQKVSIIILISLFSFYGVSSQSSPSCPQDSGCPAENIAGILSNFNQDVSLSVRTELESTFYSLKTFQSRLRKVFNGGDLRSCLIAELIGNLYFVDSSANAFVDFFMAQLIDTTKTNSELTAKIAVEKYISNISVNLFEEIFNKLNKEPGLRNLVVAFHEQSECAQDKLYQVVFHNITKPVKEAKVKSQKILKQVIDLYRTVQVDLQPTKSKVETILQQHMPIESCADLYLQNIGCRVCQIDSNQNLVSVCPNLCDQTMRYCLSSVKSSLADVDDVLRIFQLILIGLEGRETSSEFQDTLTSVEAFSESLGNLSKSVLHYLINLDYTDLIVSTARECYPLVGSDINKMNKDISNAVGAVMPNIQYMYVVALLNVFVNCATQIRDFIINFLGNTDGTNNKEIRRVEISLRDAIQSVCSSQSRRVAMDNSVCWNSSAISSYLPNFTSFDPIEQDMNPAVLLSSQDPAVAERDSLVEASRLSESASDNSACSSLETSDSSVTDVYNSLSNAKSVCYSSINTSAASRLTSSILILLAIIVVQTLTLIY